jgi:hypothetical protein
MSFGHPGLVVLQYADMFLVTLISLSHHPSQLEFDATQKVEGKFEDIPRGWTGNKCNSILAKNKE